MHDLFTNLYLSSITITAPVICTIMSTNINDENRRNTNNFWHDIVALTIISFLPLINIIVAILSIVSLVMGVIDRR